MTYRKGRKIRKIETSSLSNFPVAQTYLDVRGIRAVAVSIKYRATQEFFLVVIFLHFRRLIR